MNRRLLIFAVLAVVQLAAPLSLVAWREMILNAGTQVKFLTAPVDPVDALRGRYVALSMQERFADYPQASAGGRDRRRLYVLLTRDAQGFAHVTGVSVSRPASGLYIRARVRPYYFPARRQVQIEWPFDRYYLNERLAPQAERLYRQQAGRQNAYVTVRVLRGQAALEGLYVAGQPIERLLRLGGVR
jgi:uncharacterized membrane-anchored protein